MTSAPDLGALCADIEVAVARIQPYSVETPLLRIRLLDQLIDGEVFLKAECLQATGSFKIRGALNAVSVLAASGSVRSVVAFSSGNHGIGVGYAARCLGLTATIVVPTDAPETKIAHIRSLGAKVIFYDRQHEDREQIASTLLNESSVALVRPYDEWNTIAGQGTCGAEVRAQLPVRIDSVIVCTGGGGFAAGVGSYLKNCDPSLAIFTAEPEHWADHQKSFAAGRRIALTDTRPTLCDGLLAREPGELTFSINALNNVRGLSASDKRVIEAMQLVWQHLGLRLEPSGAVGVACLLGSREQFQGQRVVVTLSGGNVDRPLFDRLIGSAGKAA